MTRRFVGDTLIVASHNPGKVREIAALVRAQGVRVCAAGELGLPEPEETGASFAENADIKAAAAALAAGEPALADDSGLVVPILNGAPGIFSARWAGPNKDFRVAMRRLETAIAETGAEAAGQPAFFVCALSLCWPDGHCERFEGRVDGTLTFPPRGSQGFGYDPIFVPEGGAETFGELAPHTKHAMSHRARAFEQLQAACLARPAQARGEA